MSRIASHVKVKAVLKLIRAYLVGGISDNGQVNMRTLGTPQGVTDRGRVKLNL